MNATQKLFVWLGLGVILNIIYILVFNPIGIEEKVNTIQLILFIIAWIIVEGISYKTTNGKNNTREETEN